MGPGQSEDCGLECQRPDPGNDYDVSRGFFHETKDPAIRADEPYWICTDHTGVVVAFRKQCIRAEPTRVVRVRLTPCSAYHRNTP